MPTRRCLRGCWMVVVAALASMPAAGQAPSTSGEPAPLTVAQVCGGKATYEQITRPWLVGPQTLPFVNEPVELTIQTTQFSGQPVPKIVDVTGFCDVNRLSVGVNVSTAGNAHYFRSGEGSFRGGGGRTLSEADLARLEQLMDALPEDGGRVPPPERQVLLGMQRNGALAVRLYDSAALPDAALEMIRLTGAPITVPRPKFEPDKVLRPEEMESLDPPVRHFSVDVSPDGSTGVLHDFVTKTLRVYQGSRWQEIGLPQGGDVIRVIREFWQPDVYGGYAVGTEFSPDGRSLLVTWGAGALLYDTGTWQPVSDPNVFPQNLKRYLHSPDWNLGVAVTAAGGAVVWDWRAHRVVSKLPGLGGLNPPDESITDRQGRHPYDSPTARLNAAVFSPDQTQVAVLHWGESGQSLSVWDVASGGKLRELLPTPPAVYARSQPVWWNEGRWLMAAGVDYGESVWDVATGKLLGSLDLTGCDAREAVVVRDEKVEQQCFEGNENRGKGLEWSVDGVEQKRQRFADEVAAGLSVTK